MATDAKFRTVLPNNSIKELMDFTPVGTVYSETSNTVGQRENFMWANDIELSLNGMASDREFTTTVHIPPSYQLQGPAFLELVYEMTPDANPVPGDNVVSQTTYLRPKVDFAANHAVKEFAYRIPGCDRIFVKSENTAIRQIEQCDSAEKEQMLLSLSGRCGSSDNGHMGRGRHYSGNVWEERPRDNAANAPNPKRSNSVVLYYMLPTPWSTPAAIGSAHQAHPYPAHLTTSPLEYYFNIRAPREVVEKAEFYSGRGIPYDVNQGIVLHKATLRFMYGAMAAPQEYRAVISKYPTTFTYDYHYSATSDDNKLSFAFRGLRNGEIREMTLRVAPEIFTNYTGEVSNPYMAVKLKNLELTYAGQVIWKAPEFSQDAWQFCFSNRNNKIKKPTRFEVCTHVPLLDADRGGFNAYTGEFTEADQRITRKVTVLESADTHATLYAIGTDAGDGQGYQPVIDTNHYIAGDGVTMPFAGGLGWYYNIPIGESLERIIGSKNYVLGADFRDADLVFNCDLVTNEGSVGNNNNKYRCFVQVKYNGYFQFDGQTAKQIM